MKKLALILSITLYIPRNALVAANTRGLRAESSINAVSAVIRLHLQLTLYSISQILRFLYGSTLSLFSLTLKAEFQQKNWKDSLA